MKKNIRIYIILILRSIVKDVLTGKRKEYVPVDAKAVFAGMRLNRNKNANIC